MEGSFNMHAQEDTLSSEKSKRKLKTPSQIEALENLYKENKYPCESMKLQFAEQIGLSERQVSVWFCHRRLKDKKLMHGEAQFNGKHNTTNGYASVVGQESCSSSKQGEKHFDPKEVESKGSYGHNFSSVILTHEPGGQHITNGCYTTIDDRFSGSSSASYERMLQQNGIPCYEEHLRSSFQTDNYMLKNLRPAHNKRQIIDKRYSCLNVVDESSIISFLKCKLGRYYREDGPPLGIIFDPLPPGSFDSPLSISDSGPYSMGNFEQRGSCSISRIMSNCKHICSDIFQKIILHLQSIWTGCFSLLIWSACFIIKNFNFFQVYDNCSNKVLSSNSHQKGFGLKRKLQGFHCQHDVSSYHVNQKPLFPDSSNSALFQVEESLEKASDGSGTSWTQEGLSTFRSREYNNRLKHHFRIKAQIADTNKLHPHRSYNLNSLVSENGSYKI